MSDLANTYSTPEVANMLGVVTQRIHQLVNDGRLQPVPGIRPYRFTREAVDALRRVWPRPVGKPGHEVAHGAS